MLNNGFDKQVIIEQIMGVISDYRPCPPENRASCITGRAIPERTCAYWGCQVSRIHSTYNRLYPKVPKEVKREYFDFGNSQVVKEFESEHEHAMRVRRILRAAISGNRDLGKAVEEFVDFPVYVQGRESPESK